MARENMIIKLENVILDALVDESPSRTADVTDKPVEKGQDVSDHMKQNASIIRLSGSVVNDAANKLAILNNYQKEARLLTFHGRNIFANVVLLQLNTKHNAPNGKGFDYEITLKNVRIANVKTFEVTVTNPETGEQDAQTSTKVQSQTNKGRQQTKSTNSKTSRTDTVPSSQKGKGTPNVANAETRAFVDKLANQSLADALSEAIRKPPTGGGGGKFGTPTRPPQKVTFKGVTHELY